MPSLDFAAGLIWGFYDTVRAERDRREKNALDAVHFLISTGRVRDPNDLLPILGPLARETLVGESRWVAYPARETLALAAEAIRANPGITHCGDADCLRCRDAVAGGPPMSS